MKWSAWTTSDGGCLFTAGENTPEGESGACLLYTLEADSWNEAMQKHYDRQGWGRYKPMLDENGNEYPDDTLPFQPQSENV